MHFASCNFFNMCSIHGKGYAYGIDLLPCNSSSISLSIIVCIAGFLRLYQNFTGVSFLIRMQWLVMCATSLAFLSGLTGFLYTVYFSSSNVSCSFTNVRLLTELMLHHFFYCMLWASRFLRDLWDFGPYVPALSDVWNEFEWGQMVVEFFLPNGNCCVCFLNCMVIPANDKLSPTSLRKFKSSVTLSVTPFNIKNDSSNCCFLICMVLGSSLWLWCKVPFAMWTLVVTMVVSNICGMKSATRALRMLRLPPVSIIPLSGNPARLMSATNLEFSNVVTGVSDPTSLLRMDIPLAWARLRQEQSRVSTPLWPQSQQNMILALGHCWA